MRGRQPGRPRDDAGFGLVGLILGALTVMTAVAVAAVGVVIYNQHKNNPHNFTISVRQSTAVRDANDQPVITVSYRLNFVSAELMKAQQSQAHVFCAGFERGGVARKFTSEDDQFDVTNIYQFGESTLAPGERLHDLSGAVAIWCFLHIDGKLIASNHGEDVVVPAPSTPAASPSPTAGRDPLGFTGTYSVTFGYSVGSQTDCVVDGEREFTVTAVNGDTIHVALTKDDGFDSKLGSDLKFAGAIGLNPGFADYFGQLHAEFAMTANGIQLGGTMETTTPACTFVVNGVLK